MKKFILGGVVVVLLGGYALWSASRSQTPVVPAPDQTKTSAGSETTNPNGGTMMGTTSTGMMGGGMMAKFKDGTYTGSVGDAAPFGQVQVSVIITGGKIASIQALQKPEGPGQTNQIWSRAFPILVQEAITSQTAKVHIISGATQDSQGFEQSLSAALVKAHA